MKVSHRRHLTALMATISLTAACQTGEPSTPDEETETAEQAIEGRDDHHRGPPMGGPHGLFRAALSELELTEEQRAAIEASLEELAPPKPDRAAMESKAKALADAVRAGSVDPGALAPLTDARERHGAEGRAKMVAALQKLHQTLTPEQRVALVQAVEDEMSDRGGRPPHPRGKRDGQRGQGAPEARGRGGPPHGSPAGHLLRGLEVSDEQRAEIEKALETAGVGKRAEPPTKDREALREAHRAALEAFGTDRFDADALLPKAPPHAGKPHGFIEALAVVVPLLTAEQRESLADRIEEGPPGPPPEHERRGKPQR